jgi:hypothetical protein
MEWQYLWSAHNSHRILVARLCFIVNDLLFSGRNATLIAFIFFIQALHAAVIYTLLTRIREFPGTVRLAGAAFILICFFSAVQMENFTQPLQVCWTGVFLLASLASLTLTHCRRSLDAGRPNRYWVWLAATVLAAAGCNYSMANGNLIWPLLVVLALWLRLPRSAPIALAAAGCLFIALYFSGDTDAQRGGVSLLAKGPRILAYIVVYLGNPLGNLGNPQYWGIAGAVVLGIVGLAGGAFFTVKPLLDRRQPSPAIGALSLILLFNLGTAAVTALGRAGLGIVAAMSYRYRTPALIFWLVLFILSFNLLWSRRARLPGMAKAAAAVFTAGFVIALVSQHGFVTGRFAKWARLRRVAEVSLTVGTYVHPRLSQFFHAPGKIIEPAEFLRARDLSIFAGPWDDLLGTSLSYHFAVVADSSCSGYFDGVRQVAVMAGGKAGAKVWGWAWDQERAETPRRILITDTAEQIVGLAWGGSYGRPEILLAQPQIPVNRVGWEGYIRFQSPWIAPLRAYAVLSDGKSVAPLKGAHFIRPPERENLGGTALRQRFRVVGEGPCLGYFDGAAQDEEAAPGRANVRVWGWAWNRERNRVPEKVVIVDGRGRIVGVGYGGAYPRPQVRSLLPFITTHYIGWEGRLSVGGWLPPLKAYAMLPDGKTVVPLPGEHAPPAASPPPP